MNLRFESLDWVHISKVRSICLENLFTLMEIEAAIFQMNKKEASGPYGFNIDLYACWDTIEEMKVFHAFFDNGIINRISNATFIALVPKKVKLLEL